MVASRFLRSKNFVTMVTWRHTSPLYCTYRWRASVVGSLYLTHAKHLHWQAVIKGIGHCKNMNCYTLGHPKILGAEAFRDWNSDSRRSRYWYINNVTKNRSQHSWEKYLQTKNSGAPTVACDEDFCQNIRSSTQCCPTLVFWRGGRWGTALWFKWGIFVYSK